MNLLTGPASSLVIVRGSTAASTTTMAAEPPDPGYQTPTEEDHPPFIRTEPPTPTPTPPSFSSPPPFSSPAVSSVPPSAPPPRRPALLQLPSYYLQRRSESRRHVNPSLDDMLHKGVRRPKGGQVSFKERVACYQWTFFTMVCFLLCVLSGGFD